MRGRTGFKVWVGLLAIMGMTSLAWAQHGTGESHGMAQQAEQPAVETFNGTVQKVVTEACEQTTGRSAEGTHVLIETEDGQTRNVHLGPAAVAAVKEAAEALSEGQDVAVKAFRTDRMAEGHYVAQQIETDDQTFVLRDAALRPVWAGQRGAARAERHHGSHGPPPHRAANRPHGQKHEAAATGCGMMMHHGARHHERRRHETRMGQGQHHRGHGMHGGHSRPHHERSIMGAGREMGRRGHGPAASDEARGHRIERLEQRIDQLQQRLEQLEQDE